MNCRILRELEERKGKAFTRRVALATAIFAVILAIAALGGKNATKEMLLAQQQASDQWAFYQAKALREHQYRTQKFRLEVDLAEWGPAMKPNVRQKFEALMAKFTEEERRYNTEKREIEPEAKKLEHERDVHRARDPYFDFAEALLQIAIVMASIATSSPTHAPSSSSAWSWLSSGPVSPLTATRCSLSFPTSTAVIGSIPSRPSPSSALSSPPP